MNDQPPAFRLRLHHVLAALALLIFAWRAFDSFVPGFWTAEEHGYLTAAKRMATTGTFALRQNDPYAFVGEAMAQAEGESGELYYPRQSTAYPLLCAAAYFVGGPAGPLAVSPLCGLALILGVYVLGRLLKKEWPGAIAAMAVAVLPPVLYYAVRPLPHVVFLTMGVWLMVAAMAWRRNRKTRKTLLVKVPFGGAGAVIAVASAGVMAWNYKDAMTQLERTRVMGRQMVESAKIVQSQAPPGAVILADNHSAYFLDYIGRYTIYSPTMFEPEKIARRVSDLDQYPHKLDPARTREIRNLVGGKTLEELNVILRRQFRGYLSVGRPVFVFGTQEQTAYWQERLQMPMEATAENRELHLVLYEVKP